MKKKNLRVEDLVGDHRSFILILTLGIALSLIGIFSVYRPIPFSQLTGLPTNVTGTLSAEVLRSVSLSATGAISFGTGIVYSNNTGQPIVLNSTGGNCATANTSFRGASCKVTGTNSSHVFVIENDGNINVTVTGDINTTLTSLGLGVGGDIAFYLGQEEQGSTSNPACNTPNGTASGGGDASATAFFPNRTGFRRSNQSTPDFNNTDGIPNSFYSVFGAATAAARTDIILCSKLQPTDSYDTFNMTIYVNISTTAVPGAKNFLINFTALDRFTGEP